MIRKINVLFVEYCSDLTAGGAQRVFLNVLKALDPKKYHILAAFPHYTEGKLGREVPDYVESLEYDSKSPDSSKNKLLSYILFAIYTPIIVFHWCYLIRKKRIEVVYVHSIISGFHFSIVKYFINYKLIYHEHNMASQRPTMFLWRWLFGFVVSQADSIIAISSDVSNSLVEHGADRKKVIIVYNGIELFDQANNPVLRQKGLQRLRIAETDERLIIGMVGHFRPWKGQEIFIESLQTVLESRVDAHYVLIGAIHDQVYYERVVDFVARNNFSDRVTITGYQEDIPELMACFDIVVVPSVPEPFGLVLLEAMMLSKAVIAFNVGGPAEIIHHDSTGLLVDAINSKALGSSIVSLAKNRKMREEMGEKGRLRLQEKFTLKIQIQKIEKLIDGFFL